MAEYDRKILSVKASSSLRSGLTRKIPVSRQGTAFPAGQETWLDHEGWLPLPAGLCPTPLTFRRCRLEHLDAGRKALGQATSTSATRD